jgi:hypothetical protein
MSNRNKIHSKGRIQGQWTAVRREITDSAAWKEMSFGARLLYIAIIKNLSFTADNNGKLFLATRKAAEELGASQDSICFWYRELEHYGFIEMTEPGTIGPKGKAAHWRVTDVGWGTLDGKSIEATKDYLKWTGEVFVRVRPKTEKRPTKPHRVNSQTVHRGEQPNRSLGVPSEQANRSYTTPPNDRPNHSYLGQPSPCQLSSSPPSDGRRSRTLKLVAGTEVAA